jgi:hypothetical protein
MVVVPMEMPKNCSECPFVHGDATERCPFMPYLIWSEWALSECADEDCGTERHPQCPLKETT